VRALSFGWREILQAIDDARSDGYDGARIRNDPLSIRDDSLRPRMTASLLIAAFYCISWDRCGEHGQCALRYVSADVRHILAGVAAGLPWSRITWRWGRSLRSDCTHYWPGLAADRHGLATDIMFRTRRSADGWSAALLQLGMLRIALFVE
jgi:hypothetical protein